MKKKNFNDNETFLPYNTYLIISKYFNQKDLIKE
jgi:hypothetical protein